MVMSGALNSPVGFLGLGIMGKGMAARLVTQGVAGTSERPLHVWNRTPAVSEEFKAANPGATIVIAGTPQALVEACGITVSMLSTPEAAASVFNAASGTLAGVSASSCIIDCATLGEKDHKAMADAVVAKGGRYLEAPVSGSKMPAAQGALVFLCGGDTALFKEAEPALAAMGKASHFLGPVGMGTRAKLVVNSVMGTMLATFSEGMQLTKAMGLDGDTMVTVFGQGACASPMFALKGPKLCKSPPDHATHFPLKHAHKDMLLARQAAEELGVSFSINSAAEETFKRAREGGKGDLDFSAVYDQIGEQDTGKKRKTEE